jgi:hypothetical protein
MMLVGVIANVKYSGLDAAADDAVNAFVREPAGRRAHRQLLSGAARNQSRSDRGAPLRLGRAGLSVPAAAEQSHLPPIGGNIVPQDVEITLRVSDLEVAMIGSKPPVDDFSNVDLAVAEPEPPRGLLAAIAGVALDVHDRERGLLA